MTDRNPVAGGVYGGTIAEATQNPTRGDVIDEELAAVMQAWPKLPKHVRRAVLALVSAGKGGVS